MGADSGRKFYAIGNYRIIPLKGITRVTNMVQKAMVSVYPIRYRDSKLEYLMIKRATVSFNWQNVSGSVGQSLGALDHPPNETPLECAKRELFEETGYIAALLVPFDPPAGFFIEDAPKGEISPPELHQFIKETKIYVFIARIDQRQEPVLNPAEHTEWRWCSFDAAYKLIQWPVEKKGLRVVNKHLLKNPLHTKPIELWPH